MPVDPTPAPEDAQRDDHAEGRPADPDDTRRDDRTQGRPRPPAPDDTRRDDRTQGRPRPAEDPAPAGEEPWAAARAAARSEVAAALAPHERRCPACGRSSAATGRSCAACGADYAGRPPRSGPNRRAVAAGLAGLLAAIALAIVVVPDLRRDAADRRARDEARQLALEAAERVRLRRDARPRRAAGPALAPGQDRLVHREALIRRAEVLVTRDARGRVRAGTLDGPIAGATCEPFPDTAARRAIEADPAARAGRYDCVAFKRRFSLPEAEGRRRTGLLGFPYWVVIDYRRAALVWCKVTPRAGEGGQVLASVPVPAPCREPG